MALLMTMIMTKMIRSGTTVKITIEIVEFAIKGLEEANKEEETIEAIKIDTIAEGIITVTKSIKSIKKMTRITNIKNLMRLLLSIRLLIRQSLFKLLSHFLKTTQVLF